MANAIEIKNLSFTYPDGHIALNEINVIIPAGQTVALIGPNGAGKSTLIMHLNGILRSNGSVKILEQTISDKNKKWVLSKVGIVFQNPEDQLFCPTVFDDVAFGPINMGCNREEVIRRVKEALAEVSMDGFEKRSSHHLSVGEKKRIAIATVLSMNPEILVIDEPTSSLDPRGKWDLIELLHQLTQTKIIATHDLELVNAICQRTIILDKGNLVADDKTANILSNNTLLQTHGLASKSIINPQ